MATTTPNYGLTKPASTDNYSIDVFNGNADIADTELKKAEDHRVDTSNPHQVTAAQAGALPASTTALPNPSALTIQQGCGGQTGSYDGSAAKTISIPKITVSSSSPGTLAAGELWGVY